MRLAALALVLAALTWRQTDVWRSEAALWTRAVHVAPSQPRPWIGLAWVDLRAGQLDAAQVALSTAWQRTEAQPPIERDWARDAIDATRAVIFLRQGRLQEAADLMAAGPPLSERAELCHHYAAICRSAHSPSLQP